MSSIFSGACFTQSLTRRNGAKLLAAFCVRAAAFSGPLRSIPSRSLQALSGSQFTKYISDMDAQQREQAILDQLLEGNLPNFLRKPIPVQLHDARTRGVTIFVIPDYLAIGSNSDFLRIPMNLYTAISVADRFGFMLPTRKMVDAVYEQSSYRYAPQPMPAGPQMRSTQYYRLHNAMIEKQSHDRGIPHGVLVSGHKKDVVLTNRLAERPGQIAIYGWHRGAGAPIQPLSTVHGARYADYSHGIRLVSQTAMVDGKPRSIHEVLADPLLASVLSDEGQIYSRLLQQRNPR